MSLSLIYPQYLWLLVLVPLTLALGFAGRPAGNQLRRWAGLSLRLVLLIAIILALAGVQLRLRSNQLTTVFVLDVSDSISPEEQARGEDFIHQSIDHIQGASDQNQAAIVLFGEDALVDRLASADEFSRLTSIPITTRTDISSALQLAQAILPGEGARRIVLLSDGRENLGQAMQQASLAASSQVELRYVPLGGPAGEVEVLLESLRAPAEARQGERIELAIEINSSAAVNAGLRIFADDALVHTQELALSPGVNRLQVPVEPSEAGATGFRRFRAQVIPEFDTLLQNNEASAFTVVHGPPNVLLIEGQPGEAENLARALQAAEMNLTRHSPAQIPTTLTGLASYDAIILANVPANALPDGAMNALPVFVRDLGRGLVMIGGADSFGAGGYLRTPLEEALPVDMDVRDKELEANLALVLAVDKSGSMGRCHCDNPDLNQTYTRQEVGQPKVDIAKEAVMRAASALGKQDYLGVVAFDSQPHWVLNLSQLIDPASLENSIATFQAEGQTNLQAGVQAAYQALTGVEARRKHIILMTDGWVRTGDLTEIAQEMKEQGITLSVVAAGEGSAEYLAALSQLGGGSYYPATDIFRVPEFFLKETVKSVGEYIVEEPFYPLPSAPGSVLRGLDTASLPPLLGYNGTTGKNTARMDLLTPRGDPLLATWQYGLGRSAAWTSDLKGQWAKEWLAWPGFERFAPQLVSWVLPAPKVEGLTTGISLKDGEAVIELSAIDKAGLPLNFLEGSAAIVDPDMETVHAPLTQVGSGRYEATTRVDQPGTYLVRLGVNQGDQSLGQVTLGFVVPYSPEYRSNGVNSGLLSQLALVTGGGILDSAEQAFLRTDTLTFVPQARQVWAPLLLLAALLFPLDVALRRVVISRKDLQQARAWLHRQAVIRRQPDTSQPRVLGRLFTARDRVRHRRTPPADAGIPPTPSIQEPATPKPPAALSAVPPASQPQSTGPDEQAQGDSLERLRQAKKRARR